VLQHILVVGGVEVGAIEEQSRGDLVGEAEGEVDLLLLEVVVGRGLGGRDRAREEIPVPEDGYSTG